MALDGVTWSGEGPARVTGNLEIKSPFLKMTFDTEPRKKWFSIQPFSHRFVVQNPEADGTCRVQRHDEWSQEDDVCVSSTWTCNEDIFACPSLFAR